MKLITIGLHISAAVFALFVVCTLSGHRDCCYLFLHFKVMGKSKIRMRVERALGHLLVDMHLIAEVYNT